MLQSNTVLQIKLYYKSGLQYVNFHDWPKAAIANKTFPFILRVCFYDVKNSANHVQNLEKLLFQLEGVFWWTFSSREPFFSRLFQHQMNPQKSWMSSKQIQMQYFSTNNELLFSSWLTI